MNIKKRLDKLYQNVPRPEKKITEDDAILVARCLAVWRAWEQGGSNPDDSRLKIINELNNKLKERGI